MSTVDPLLPWLRVSNRWEPLRAAHARERALLDVASARGLSVDDEDLQVGVDAWRKSRGLRSPKATATWLAENGATQADVESHVSAALLRAALENSLTLEELRLYSTGQDGALDAVRVSVIETRSASTAAALLARLEAGESFEALARAESTDGGSGPEGGSLGWLARRDVPAPLRPALFSAQTGTAAGPVAYQGRWYLVRRDEGPVTPSAQALDVLRADVAGQLIEQAL